MPNYSELLAKLFYACRASKTPYALENILKLDKELGCPSKAFPTIHVGGTNGKGSVSTKIAKALSCHGLKVGLFTSPHLLSYRERIRINGEMISEDHAKECLSLLFGLIEKNNLPARFFEITTALAMHYFKENHVDIAVIEVGLGGRKDATNIIHPLISVITSIGMDHEHLLGNTKEKIAYEKAGIIKNNVPIVIGPSVPFDVVSAVAKENNAPLHIVKDDNFVFFDEENQEIAKKSLSLLPWKLSPSAIQAGLKARPLCRFYEMTTPSGHCLIFDVAHNSAAFPRLYSALEKYYPGSRIVSVLGLTERPHLKECLDIAVTASKKTFFVDGFSERAVKKEKLYEFAPDKEKSCCTLLDSALNEALAFSAPDTDLIVITGSCFLMGPMLKQAGIRIPEDPVVLRESV